VTKTHEFEVNGGTGKIIVKLASVPKLTYYGEDILLTGHSVWFGALNAIQLMTDLVPVFDPSFSTSTLNILEIGAGTGLAGLFQAKLLNSNTPNQPYNLFLTDGEDDCVSTLQSNACLNGLCQCCPSLSVLPASNSVHCSQLWWGKDQPQLQTLFDDAASSSSSSFEGFDIIIGSDLIYSSKQVPTVKLLFETVYASLKVTPNAVAEAVTKRVVLPGYGVDTDADDEEAFMPKVSADFVCNPKGGGVFYLAFTRRNMPVQTVLGLAEDIGLSWMLIEDYCWDVFDNNTDGITEMWRDAIYCFWKVEKKGV